LNHEHTDGDISKSMKTKVYILLSIREGKPAEIACKLKGQTGVKNVEALDGSPEIIITLEANGRQKLARFSVSALESVEYFVESVKLMPVLDNPGFMVK